MSREKAVAGLYSGLACMIDADPQGSARDWSAAGGVVKADAIPRATIHNELGELAGDAEHVVIDAAPRLADVARSALMAADLAILPVVPGGMDLWALDSTIELIKAAQGIRPELGAAIVLNRVAVDRYLRYLNRKS